MECWYPPIKLYAFKTPEGRSLNGGECRKPFPWPCHLRILTDNLCMAIVVFFLNYIITILSQCKHYSIIWTQPSQYAFTSCSLCTEHILREIELFYFVELCGDSGDKTSVIICLLMSILICNKASSRIEIKSVSLISECSLSCNFAVNCVTV
jgi:hypothetical protein